MRTVEKHPQVKTLRVDAGQRAKLEAYLQKEIEDAKAARWMWDSLCRDLLRLYEGVPQNPVKNTPIENAPNTEITLGAIASDAIYAQAVDLIWTASPIITARATTTDGKWTEHAKAIQAFANWGVANEWNIRQASDHAILDDIQLGSGVYYIPWVENSMKTKVAKITHAGPRAYKIPVEDFFVPGGADEDPQRHRWIAMRWWLDDNELADREKDLKWDVSGFIPVGIKGWVRSYRETLGRTTSSAEISELYEVFNVYCRFDIDGDDIAEDLLVIFDGSSYKIAKVEYAPYDSRPIETMRYQLRAHLFYGIGVMEMIRPFQIGVTDSYNHWMTNMLLANCRLWKAKRGQLPPSPRFWPNKVIEMDDPKSLEPVEMADVYQSGPQAIAMTISLAERRTGVNEMSLPRPSQVLGSRTPGITALSLLQQVNRRFTPAFDSIRIATAGAVRQCLFRYSEQIKAGNKDAEQNITKVLGAKDGNLAIEVLRDPDFDKAIAVELTASSASVNRDADRQNAIMLVNILAQYYQRVMELVTISSNPQVAPEVKTVASKIAKAAGEIIERTIRTFDQIRDPRTFIVSVEEELDGLAGLSKSGLDGLGRILSLVGGPQANGAANGTQRGVVDGVPTG